MAGLQSALRAQVERELGEIEVIKRWLQEKRTSNWPGVSFHLQHEDELGLAAAWFRRMMMEYADKLIEWGYADPRGVIEMEMEDNAYAERVQDSSSRVDVASIYPGMGLAPYPDIQAEAVRSNQADYRGEEKGEG